MLADEPHKTPDAKSNTAKRATPQFHDILALVTSTDPWSSAPPTAIDLAVRWNAMQIRLTSVADEHRYIDATQHLVGFAAKHQAIPSRAAMRTHDDQIAIIPLRRTDDSGIGAMVESVVAIERYISLPG